MNLKNVLMLNLILLLGGITVGLGYAASGPLPIGHRYEPLPKIVYEEPEEPSVERWMLPVQSIPPTLTRATPVEFRGVTYANAEEAEAAKHEVVAVFNHGAEIPDYDEPFEADLGRWVCHYPVDDVIAGQRRESTLYYAMPQEFVHHINRHQMDYQLHNRYEKECEEVE